MKHVSYSEIKIWNECPFKHKLQYIDKIAGFKGNEYTAFGTALHSVCEFGVAGVLDRIDFEDHFQTIFENELDALPQSVELRENLVAEMRTQAEPIHSQVLDALESFMPEYRVHATEEQLFEPIKEFTADNCDFKGFIDLVLQSPDGKYHIIDWKTCSWGWDQKRKSDRMTTYQLTLYKKFWCQKNNIDPSMVETYFGLLKRTAKKNNVEIFRVTSGPRKMENATKFLFKAVTAIHRGIKIKNRMSCRNCNFNKTEHCS
ncbi:PD-(D/E)XK nuclease family protein [Candidatus Pelagibacter bacterium]|nr:PD-(D/E)XK nuclease family protein [Candidatus Pelagibacter bacterium]